MPISKLGGQEMAGRNMPVADLSRVTDFVKGVEQEADARHAATRKALLETIAVYGGVKAWQVYRNAKKGKR
jgi:hypothetical protein